MKRNVNILIVAVMLVLFAIAIVVVKRFALFNLDGPTAVFFAGKLSGGQEQVAEYVSITMEDAKENFAEKGDYIILDVRTAEEFAEGHIPGAINIANEDILETEPVELPDKEQVIYIYCRSGNRSKQAAEKLALMGYTNIIEFGGIIDWTGELEK